ncbi:hypothetical protein COOONC_02535 [Cooperia oncophora]
MRKDSDYVLNGTARILVHFADRLDADQIRCIVNTTQSRGVAGDVVYQLAAKVRPDMTLADDLALNKWHNETARCQTIMKLVQSSPKRSDLSDLLDTVLLSPSVKLSNFVSAIDLMDNVQIKSFLTGICRFMMDRRRAPLSDLQQMLAKLSSRLDIADLAMLLGHCFPRLLNKTKIFLINGVSMLCKAIATYAACECLNDPAMADIRDRLALEITKGPLSPLVRFDPSPYVRDAASLRC